MANVEIIIRNVLKWQAEKAIKETYVLNRYVNVALNSLESIGRLNRNGGKS